MAMNKTQVNPKTGLFPVWFSRLSTARQIFAPAKSAFPPSLAVRCCRQGYGEVLTPRLESRLGNNLN